MGTKLSRETVTVLDYKFPRENGTGMEKINFMWDWNENGEPAPSRT